jgi:phosphomevalonate kinase
MREMGQRAGVEIEPPFQTRIADATEALPGVLCAGVPGAGGCDALFAIYLQVPNNDAAIPPSMSVRESVEELWSTWSERESEGEGDGPVVVCPLMLAAQTAGSAGICCHPDGIPPRETTIL